MTNFVFNRDFADFIRCLNNAGVEYMLVGGYATIIHGYNRTTGDLDIWVGRTAENFKKLSKAFKEFQMPLFDMSRERFLHDNTVDVFTFGRSPVCIDIITRLKGLEFAEVWKRKETQVVGGVKVNNISLEDLIAAKRAVNRPKDQDDIEHLRNYRP